VVNCPVCPSEDVRVGHQPPLPGIPFSCGWNTCHKDAVCGLHHKEGGFVVNTCPAHFNEVTGKDWPPPTEGERADREEARA